MPTYKYINNDGDRKTMTVSFNLRDKQDGWTRVASYPTEIRTDSNAETHVDGRAQRDPKWAQHVQVAKMNEEACNSRPEKAKEIREDIKKLKKDVF